MRCQGCVEPGVAPMAIPEPARGARNQHTRSVRDVVGIHCIGLRLIDSIERRQPVVAAVGAAATDDPTQRNVYSGMAAVDKRQTDDRRRVEKTPGKASGKTVHQKGGEPLGFPWANSIAIRHDF